MGFRNIRDEGIQKVATAADRLALLPTDGTIVEQLDNHTLYIYDQSTNTWNPVGVSANAFGIVQTPFGTAPVADAPSDTLTLTSSDGSVTITGNATTDTIDIKTTALGGVTSVSNIDGTLTISPTTGAVVASLAPSGATAGTYEILGGTVDATGRLTTALEKKPTVIAMALIFG